MKSNSFIEPNPSEKKVAKGTTVMPQTKEQCRCLPPQNPQTPFFQILKPFSASSNYTSPTPSPLGKVIVWLVELTKQEPTHFRAPYRPPQSATTFPPASHPESGCSQCHAFQPRPTTAPLRFKQRSRLYAQTINYVVLNCL